MNKKTTKSTAQEIQDQIFRKMTAERKFELWSDLRQFAMELAKAGTFYERKNRPKTTLDKSS